MPAILNICDNLVRHHFTTWIYNSLIVIDTTVFIPLNTVSIAVFIYCILNSLGEYANFLQLIFSQDYIS